MKCSMTANKMCGSNARKMLMERDDAELLPKKKKRAGVGHRYSQLIDRRSVD